MLSTKWLLSRKVSPWAGFYTLKVRELRHSSVCLVQVAAVAVGPGAGEVTCGHEHRTKQLRHIMTHYPQAELLITATNNMEYPIVTIVANHRQLLVICLVFFIRSTTQRLCSQQHGYRPAWIIDQWSVRFFSAEIVIPFLIFLHTWKKSGVLCESLPPSPSALHHFARTGEGDWSDSAQICTEALAPEVRGE